MVVGGSVMVAVMRGGVVEGNKQAMCAMSVMDEENG